MTTKKDPRSVDTEFREALQGLLWRAGGNRKELAVELDVHLSTLSRWLNGLTLPSPRERELVFSLLRQKVKGSFWRLVQMYSGAPPRQRAALKALVDRGIDAWEEFDPATQDEVCNLLIKIHSE